MKNKNTLKIFVPFIIFSAGILMLIIYAVVDKYIKYEDMVTQLEIRHKTIGARISSNIENRELVKINNQNELIRLFAYYSIESLNLAKIYDQNDKMIFKTIPVISNFTDTMEIDKKYLEQVREDKLPFIKIDIENHRLYGVYHIMLPVQKNKIQSEDVGLLYLEFDISKEIEKTINNIYRSVFINSIIIFVMVLILFIILYFKIFKRIDNLIRATKKLENGDFDFRIEKLGNDELSIVLQSYNDMAMQLKEQFKELTKAKDEAQTVSKYKSEFLANMSHEIRTPLNAIVGFVDILKDESRGRKSMEYVEIIDDSSKNLLQIIEDILDFSKIESGKLDIEKIDFNSKLEFEVITHLFSAKCSEKDISLSLIIDEKLPKVINTDPLRIKQVISNLLSNAIKFTDDGKNIKVIISYEDNQLNISVKDEGKGIAKDKLSHIFEAFSQEDTSTTREYGGTGLGLTISSKLIKLLGGNLKVKSELGVGSEFYFSIPAKIGEEPKEIITIEEDIKFKDKKILLVEDNKANQIFMKVVLKKLELEFDIANDGLEAIDMFKDNRYDAILMDENMPNMNGIEATSQILIIESQKELQHTPIIALTANALKGDRERFLNAGMDEYMTKPINKQKLTEVLGKFL